VARGVCQSLRKPRWREAEGTEEFFYGHFSPLMPDLNFDNRAVRDSIYDIGRFWLEKGVDGFRLDAAKHIFPDHRHNEIPAFWEEFRREMESVNEDVLLVGEVWAETEEVKQYLNGLPSLFNFDMANVILEAVKTGYGADLAHIHSDIIDAYSSVTDDFIDATFLSNHDQDRVISVLGDEFKARIAANILFTLPGAPYIYYGEEIGMYGEESHPNVREPMLWNKPPDEIRSTWRVAEWSTDETVTPVSIQLADENSLLNHYKELIALRNTRPALTYGELEPIEVEDDQLVIFLRTHEEEELLIAHNVGTDRVDITLPELYRDFSVVIYPAEEGPEITADEISLPAHSSIVLKKPQ
jgi:alpha-amylase